VIRVGKFLSFLITLQFHKTEASLRRAVLLLDCFILYRVT